MTLLFTAGTAGCRMPVYLDGSVATCSDDDTFITISQLIHRSACGLCCQDAYALSVLVDIRITLGVLFAALCVITATVRAF